MIVLAENEDACAGGEGHTICGFYDSENDRCYFKLDKMHGRSCANYEANDSCMFCAIQKNFKCMLACDWVSNIQGRCEDFRPIAIEKFYR